MNLEELKIFENHIPKLTSPYAYRDATMAYLRSKKTKYKEISSIFGLSIGRTRQIIHKQFRIIKFNLIHNGIDMELIEEMSSEDFQSEKGQFYIELFRNHVETYLSSYIQKILNNGKYIK